MNRPWLVTGQAPRDATMNGRRRCRCYGMGRQRTQRSILRFCRFFCEKSSAKRSNNKASLVEKKQFLEQIKHFLNKFWEQTKTCPAKNCWINLHRSFGGIRLLLYKIIWLSKLDIWHFMALMCLFWLFGWNLLMSTWHRFEDVFIKCHPSKSSFLQSRIIFLTVTVAMLPKTFGNHFNLAKLHIIFHHHHYGQFFVKILGVPFPGTSVSRVGSVLGFGQIQYLRVAGIHSWNFISGGILEIRKSGVEATRRQKEIHSRILYHDDDSKARSGLFPHLMAFQKDR